jgi:starch-binding outer membrane protein, SusD/RagB family
MKSKIIITLIFATLFAGCEFLDYSEKSFYDDPEDIFDNFNRTSSFLADIYNRLPADYNSIDGAMRAAASDEAEYVKQNSNIQDFSNGQWSAFNTLDANWSNMYSGIRSVNFFLDQIEGRTYEGYQYTTDPNSFEDEMKRIDKFQYEARFLRAFFYFELAKRYGDIPMPDGVIDDFAEINSIGTTPFDDVIQFIVDECDAIHDSLHVSWENVIFVETGRVTRGAVQALKVKALLYAASPLHNTTNDVSKWEAAAEAANAFLVNPALDTLYAFDAAYYNSSDMTQGVFNNRSSTELIFERRQGTANSFEKSNFPIGIEGANGNATCPSQNLVDAFQTSDGFDVSIDDNGIWSAGASTVFDPANPYDNRDPRLLQSILVNGKKWKGSPVETFIGGANGQPTADATPTGYYLKKYVRQDIEISGSNEASKEHMWVIFRLADIYLSYAEAVNEAYGASTVPAGFIMDATTALNFVRTRTAVGMPAVSGLDDDQLRSAIIRERQVELAFEDHRFWDVRRWRLYDDANPNKVTEDVYGIEIENDNGTLSYSKILVDDRVWDDKMYLYPIPYNETNINPNLTQNTGW